MVLFRFCEQRQWERCWQEAGLTEWGHNEGPQVAAHGESAEWCRTALRPCRGGRTQSSACSPVAPRSPPVKNPINAVWFDLICLIKCDYHRHTGSRVWAELLLQFWWVSVSSSAEAANPDDWLFWEHECSTEAHGKKERGSSLFNEQLCVDLKHYLNMNYLLTFIYIFGGWTSEMTGLVILVFSVASPGTLLCVIKTTVVVISNSFGRLMSDYY